MQDKIFVSVIVPIYNVEKYVGKCINSLITQTYQNLEIILVNDGSVDGSKVICEEYAKKDKRVLIINKENKGLISARKSGIKIAKGDYIAYVDGDDWVKPNMFETLVNYIKESKADVIVAGHIEKWNEHEEIQLNKIADGIYSGKSLEKNIYNIMMYSGKFSQPGIFSYVWGKLFKREILISSQLDVDENIFIGEDAACLYPCLLHAKVIQVVNDTNYYYRQRIGSMIKSPNVNEIEKIANFYNYLKDIFEKTTYKVFLMEQLNYFTLSLLTVRSNFIPESFKKKDVFYPFKNINASDRVILYGAGTFGQILYSRINKSNESNLIGWVDEIYQEYNGFGLKVSSPKILNEKEYDKIMIAYIDESIAVGIENRLLRLGINNNKISKVLHYDTEDIKQILSEYNLDV